MTPIRCRWHDAGVLEVPDGTSAQRAAMGFALYGVRLQSEGISPGPIEAIVTVTDRHGHLVGHLDLDAVDSQFMVDAISGLLNHHYRPWTSQDVEYLRADPGAEPPA